MSNNDLYCSKCKSQHHPVECPLDEDDLEKCSRCKKDHLIVANFVTEEGIEPICWKCFYTSGKSKKPSRYEEEIAREVLFKGFGFSNTEAEANYKPIAQALAAYRLKLAGVARTFADDDKTVQPSFEGLAQAIENYGGDVG